MIELPPLDDTEKLALAAILSVVMIIVVFFEMRIIRGKSKEIKRVSQRKDEAYNAILTTRTVMNVMRNQGQDVSKAEKILDRAKAALQRGDFEGCKDLCERARDELTSPSKLSADKSTATEEEKADGEWLERVAESILSAQQMPRDAESYTGSKLPVEQNGNYLSAKFEISAAKADIGRARSRDQETGIAQDLLTDAESAFVTGGYTKALSLAVKARKAIGAVDETIPLKTKSEPEEEEPEAEPTPDESSAPFVEECKNCGASLDANDAFCHKCGEKIKRQRICKKCGTKARANDKFCRKCGAKVA